jgi:hypothetical protein
VKTSLKLGLFAVPLVLLSGIFFVYTLNLSLDFQSVPTVISGLASSTSIVVGFSGTLIGFIFRGTGKKDELTFRLRAVIASAIVGLMFSAAFLFIAFMNLTMSNYTGAVKVGLLGLLFSLCTFFGLALVMVDKMIDDI